MSVVFTFDVSGAALVGGQDVRNRVQTAFQRLGWQHLGGTAYRYPRFGAEHTTEDWLNHVVPALMLFRTLIQTNNINLVKYTLDIQSSTGFDGNVPVGSAALPAAGIPLYDPNNPNMFGEANLRAWIAGIASPY
jgi:hypothetical protein